MTQTTVRGSRFLLVSLMIGAAAASGLLVACSRSVAFGPPTFVATAGPPLVPFPGEPMIGNTESYDRIDENPFLAARDNPLSTFSIDVDTASYSNVRRFLNEGHLPPPDAVRIEELVNYFQYADPAPLDGEPLAVRTEVGPCPWTPANRLVRIGMRSRGLPAGQPMPPRNLVFLIDVSGSMDMPAKLPLVKRGLSLLAETLGDRDRISLVVYAGAAGMVLPPTPGSDHRAILRALDRLEAGGSTNGGGGIELAYATAERSFIPGGVNRVLLATDGDFNVGVSSPGALTRLIEVKRERGVFLTVLGFGMGNLKDSTMERLADRGNGNYAYIDSMDEARKVLVEDAPRTLITVAKDVKIQVEMNPAEVRRYRLLGYENRLLRKEQFDDDREDAGELGADQTVTALYEIEPAGGATTEAVPLRYQAPAALSSAARGGELFTIKVRYKQPEGGDSRLRSWPVSDGGATTLAGTSPDFRFAAGVAAFGMVLRQSPHRGAATAGLALELGRAAGADAGGDRHRREFLTLAERAGALGRKND
jgi:Ca-activated chloride channel family protein